MKLPKKQIKIERPKKRGPGPNDPEPGRKVRFEATIHAGRKARIADLMNHLGIDRVPDPKGRVRALLTADECVGLLDQGFEIRLYHAHAVRPLDPSLIETDESVRLWLDEERRGINRSTESKGSTGREGN